MSKRKRKREGEQCIVIPFHSAFWKDEEQTIEKTPLDLGFGLFPGNRFPDNQGYLAYKEMGIDIIAENVTENDRMLTFYEVEAVATVFKELLASAEITKAIWTYLKNDIGYERVKRVVRELHEEGALELLEMIKRTEQALAALVKEKGNY